MDELHMYFLVLISQMYSQSKNQDDLFFIWISFVKNSSNSIN